jgi:hypothetical protein
VKAYVSCREFVGIPKKERALVRRSCTGREFPEVKTGKGGDFGRGGFWQRNSLDCRGFFYGKNRTQTRESPD